MKSIETRVSRLEKAGVSVETLPYAELLHGGPLKAFILSVTHDCPACRVRAAERLRDLGDGESLSGEGALRDHILAAIHDCPPCRERAAARLLEMEGAGGE